MQTVIVIVPNVVVTCSSVCVHVDVNECAQSPAVCPVGECVNALGSYRCVCPPGYRSSNQQTSCQGDVSFLFVSFACVTR